MRLLRRSTGVAWLALIALIGQLVLSFGHAHSRAGAVIAFRQQAATQAVFAGSDTATAIWKSHKAPGPDRSESDCSVCWTMSIAQALVLPVGLEIRLPTVAMVDCFDTLTTRLPRAQSAHFQVRAPPVTLT